MYANCSNITIFWKIINLCEIRTAKMKIIRVTTVFEKCIWDTGCVYMYVCLSICVLSRWCRWCSKPPGHRPDAGSTGDHGCAVGGSQGAPRAPGEQDTPRQTGQEDIGKPASPVWHIQGTDTQVVCSSLELWSQVVRKQVHICITFGSSCCCIVWLELSGVITVISLERCSKVLWIS